MGLAKAFFIWWLRRPRYRWSRLRRRLLEGRYRNAELPPVTSLEDIEARLKEVTWTGDGPLHLYDAISYPQTVWANKKDDCDGFAVLSAELLRRWSPSSHPVLITAIVRPAQRSHTVCAFRQGNGLWFFDNDVLRRGDFPGYSDVVAEFTRGTTALVCWDVLKPETLETAEFHVV